MGTNQIVINEADLRGMSPGERRRLAHALAHIDYPQPLMGIYLTRGRRLGALVSVIACLIVTSTLLCCDAWFDVVLDAGTSDVWLSVASAAVVELPLAFIMFNTARRLIRLSAVVAVSASGGPGGDNDLPRDDLPPLWKIPLFGGFPAPRH